MPNACSGWAEPLPTYRLSPSKSQSHNPTQHYLFLPGMSNSYLSILHIQSISRKRSPRLQRGRGWSSDSFVGIFAPPGIEWLGGLRGLVSPPENIVPGASVASPEKCTFLHQPRSTDIQMLSFMSAWPLMEGWKRTPELSFIRRRLAKP